MPDAGTSAELVASTAQAGADDMAALEALDPQARELAVTRWLSEARVSLAHALETSDPAQVANFKAQVATVAEATKQLGLSKEIQLDAQEMVRRAERGVGLAVRKGQAEGTVARRGQGGANPPGSHRDRVDSGISLPKHFASEDAFFSNGAGIYHLTDDVSDEQFEEALTDAKSEDNLSRANVVRKIKGEGSAEGRRRRADLIAELAQQGYSSRQMPSRVGVTEETVRQIARDFNIEIPADKIIGRTRRLNHTDMVESTVTALDDLVGVIDFIDFSQVDRAGAAEWATSLTNSIAALKRFQNKIKELTQ